MLAQTHPWSITVQSHENTLPPGLCILPPASSCPHPSNWATSPNWVDKFHFKFKLSLCHGSQAWVSLGGWPPIPRQFHTFSSSDFPFPILHPRSQHMTCLIFHGANRSHGPERALSTMPEPACICPTVASSPPFQERVPPTHPPRDNPSPSVWIPVILSGLGAPGTPCSGAAPVSTHAC